MNILNIVSKYSILNGYIILEDGIYVSISIYNDLKSKISSMEDELIKNGYYMEIKDIENSKVIIKIFEAPKPQKQNYILHLVLFILTIISTLMAGAFQLGANPFSLEILKGLPFSISIMTILLFHEMGHYILSRKFKVDATLPYFIPFPNPIIGTMGAVIRIRSIIPNKKSLLYIGAAGPWLGLIVAIIALIIGLKLSKIVPNTPSGEGFTLGESLLFKIIANLVIGDIENKIIILHPIAFAGWLGLFVTNLNLIPIGQLDGGHIAYSLFGKYQKYISIITWIFLIIFGFLYWSGWLVWAILTLILGLTHPKPLNDFTELSKKDKIYAVLSLILFILTFMPNPIKV
jgi:membrane-associated protease RseP (regulator of RpoE activity)